MLFLPRSGAWGARTLKEVLKARESEVCVALRYSPISPRLLEVLLSRNIAAICYTNACMLYYGCVDNGSERCRLLPSLPEVANIMVLLCPAAAVHSLSCRRQLLRYCLHVASWR